MLVMADLDSAHTLSSCSSPEENQESIHLFVVACFCSVSIMFCSSVPAGGQSGFSKASPALPWHGLAEAFCSWIGRACLKIKKNDNDNSHNHNDRPTSNCRVLSRRHHLSLPFVFDYKESRGRGAFLDTPAPREEVGLPMQSQWAWEWDKAEVEITLLWRRKAIMNRRTFLQLLHWGLTLPVFILAKGIVKTPQHFKCLGSIQWP